MLLFLTKETTGSADPSPFPLPKNSFRPVNDEKFLVDDATATLEGSSGGRYRIVTSDYQIRQVVEAQFGSCK